MIWKPTMNLRWVRVFGRTDWETENTLQQQWISELGEAEWRDIDVVIN